MLPSGAGMGLWHDLLPLSARPAPSRWPAKTPRHALGQPARGRHTGLVASRGGVLCGLGDGGGVDARPNATDRRKLGSKQHLITDAQRISPEATSTDANTHTVTSQRRPTSSYRRMTRKENLGLYE